MRESIIQHPWTKEEFIKQRSNQVFESRANQIRYNNAKARERRKMTSTINKTLEKNREVLQQILGDETVVDRSREFMLGAGYNFNIFTHHIKIEGVLWYGIYEYAFRMFEKGEQFRIIKTDQEEFNDK